MEFRQAANQRQAQASAAGLAAIAVVDLREGLEDPLGLVRRDARAVVGHAERYTLGPGAAAGDRDVAAFRRELDGIGYEVQQDLPNRAFIGDHEWQIPLDRVAQHLMPGAGPRLHEPLDGLDERSRVERT